MARLVIPEALHAKLHDHLLQDGAEHLAFMLCSASSVGEEAIFLAREVILVPDSDLEGDLQYGLSLKLEGLLAVVNAAVKKKLVLVEAHSHPFSEFPRFSGYDMDGFEEIVPYMLDSLPRAPYGATVWGKTGITGLSWTAWPREGSALSVSVVGKEGVRWPSIGLEPARGDKRHDRQVRMLGKAATARIRKLKIAVVGLSGLGSHVAQQLTHLGARLFVFIDPETVDETNLNRLVGARSADVGRAKVAVMEDLVKGLCGAAEVLPIAADLRTHAALEALKGVDLVFGCIDNDGARLVLNELCLAYRIPLVDCGVEATVEDGELVDAGGRVNFVLPDGPCLHCMGQLDLREAHSSLSSEEEKRQARKMGYIRGDDEPSPAVISLNGAVASIAITELLLLLSGVRRPAPFLVYDALGGGRGRDAQWLTPQRQDRDAGCFECTLAGIGDDVDLGRYELRAEAKSEDRQGGKLTA